MKKCDCFLMAVPPKYNRMHLFVALTNPDAQGKLVAVNATSDVLRAGREFVLKAGDHECITHDSFISFSDAILADEASIVRMSKAHVIHLKPALDEALVAKIIEVAKAGKSMPEEKKILL